MATVRWHARPLVGLTIPALARETYQQLRDLDQALRRSNVFVTTLDGLSDVVITTGAAHDTLRFDGTTWRNSAFLQNTTSQVRIGGNPGTLPNPAVTPILTGLGGGYYFKATTGNAYSIMFGDGVPAGHSILSQGAGGWAELDLEYYGTGTGIPNLYFSHARGTTTAPDYPQSGDLLGRIEYHSYAGAGVYPSDRAEGARFDCLADGTWTVSSRPTRFEVYTTPSGATTPLMRFKVDKDGKTWQVGTNIVQLGTITADQQTQTQEVTWNNAGVTFVADYLNVVPTAYANGSKLLDYRVSGTSRFFIQLSTSFSQAFVSIVPPDNQTAIQIGGTRTGTGGERIVNIAPTLNTSGNPILVDINATHVAAGISTQLLRVARDSNALFNVAYEGNVGIAGGSTSDVLVRIGQGVYAGSQVEEGLQVNPTLSATGGLSHWVLTVNGGGVAGTYTTPAVYGIQINTYTKATNQTITTWYGLDILAGPAAGTKWSIRAAENVWVKGNLTVDGTITGFTGIGAHTHVETDITDGSLLARVAANESITGAWTFAPSTTATAIAVTQAVGANGIVVAGGTQTTSQPVLDLAQTWNAGAVTFRGLEFAVTNTASQAGSTVLRLLVGGSAILGVTRQGVVTVAGTATSTLTKFDLSGSVEPGGAGYGTGLGINTTLTSTANNQVLYGVRVAPLASPGAYTGLDYRQVSLDVDSTGVTGTKYGLYLGEISGGSVANYTLYTTGGTHRLGGTTNIASGVLQMAGTQVVTTRRTGYTNAMTGTADRATAYATSTITLQQLAERVKAIQDDLTTHGIIGV